MATIEKPRTEPVTATPEALEMIERLRQRHGPIAFFQPAGCCDGGTAMCITRAELLESDEDLKLGEVGGSPFFVNREMWERSGEPDFILDLASGEAGFSLGGAERVHFVTRAPAPAPAARRTARRT